MEKRSITCLSSSGRQLQGYVYLPEGTVRGMVQIVHGMAEHMERYDETCRCLADHGYAACIHNHVGHGVHTPEKERGDFGKGDGFTIMVEDIDRFRAAAAALCKPRCWFLLGHSMGSFLTRAYIQRHHDIAGVILTGTGQKSAGQLYSGIMVARIAGLFGFGRKPGKLVQSLAFSSGYAWLTRDEEIRRRYEDDPACGFPFTNAGYASFFMGMLALRSDKAVQPVDKNLPIMLLSGAEDSVGDKGAGVRLVLNQLRKAGVKDVTLKLYPDARHEILNEINRDEVRQDVLAFLDRCTSAAG